MKPESLKERLEKRIARKRGDVFLRADFGDMGGYDQVGRALRELVRGQLMKVGYGMYAPLAPSLIDGKPTLTKGIRELATEALGRLGIETVPTRMEQAYNARQTAQVPTGRVIGILGKRIRRKIGYGEMFLSFERASPDRPKKRQKADQPGRTREPPITVREALRLVWEADRYPIRGNEDWRASALPQEESASPSRFGDSIAGRSAGIRGLASSAPEFVTAGGNSRSRHVGAL